MRSVTKSSLAFAGLSLLVPLLSGTASQAAVLGLNFDEVPAPCSLSETSPLTDEYQASHGITFSGGAAIVNECWSHPFMGDYSPPNILAWDNNTYASLPVVMEFDQPIDAFSAFVGHKSGRGATTLTGYLGDTQVVSTTVATTSFAKYLSLSDGVFDRVVLDANVVDGYIDNILFRTAPDLTAPAIEISADCDDAGDGDWCRADIDLEATAYDSGSGLASLVCTLSDHDPGCGPRTLSTDGVFTFSADAMDNAGNGAVESLEVKRDATAPSSNFSTADGSVVLGVAGETINGSSSDATSGVASVAVTVTSVATGESSTASPTLTCESGVCSWSVTPSGAPGLYEISAAATDAAGNEETAGAPITVLVIALPS
jgi:hypothetical protein